MKFKSSYDYYLPHPDLRHSQLQIWQSFLGITVDLGVAFKNPTRPDKSPGAKLKEYNGNIRLFDPPSKYHNMTVFDAIMMDYNCGFHEACQIAYLKLKVRPVSNRVIRETPKRVSIKTERTNWDATDKKFWNYKTGVTISQLEFEKCYRVKRFWMTDREGIYRLYNPKDNAYVNHINNNSKIYIPKTRIWYSNLYSKDIGGNTPFNSNILILNKNLKSYLCTVNIGYDSRYLINEGSKIPVEIMKEWDKRFDWIVSIMDPDLGGLLANNTLWLNWKKTIGNDKFIQAPLPETNTTYIDAFGTEKLVKDPYDYAKAFNLKYLKDNIEQIIFNKC